MNKNSQQLHSVPILRSTLSADALAKVIESFKWCKGMRANYVNEWGTTYFSERLVTHILAFIRKTMDRIDAS